MNPAAAHLNEVAVAQLFWKPSQCRDIAAKIVQRAIEHPGTLWPDEVKLADVTAADKNLIGIAWRNLKGFGVLEQTGKYRPSVRPEANGRIVFEYRMENLSKAQAWLKANGYVKPVLLKHEQMALV